MPASGLHGEVVVDQFGEDQLQGQERKFCTGLDIKAQVLVRHDHEFSTMRILTTLAKAEALGASEGIHCKVLCMRCWQKWTELLFRRNPLNLEKLSGNGCSC